MYEMCIKILNFLKMNATRVLSQQNQESHNNKNVDFLKSISLNENGQFHPIDAL